MTTPDAVEKPVNFRKGLADGLPICLGYISVAFTFGMMTTEKGLPIWSAVLISISNFTSSGQFAGTTLLAAGASYLQIALTTFIINIRYILMGVSLSQKLPTNLPIWQRCLIAFGNSDEIFAVSMQQKGQLNLSYYWGIFLPPWAGWTLGTLAGATAVSLLPEPLRSALGIAIYGMFAAVIIPPARRLKPVAFTVLVSAIISCLFFYLPGLKEIGKGWVIIICAILAPIISVLRFPTPSEVKTSSEEAVQR